MTWYSLLLGKLYQVIDLCDQSLTIARLILILLKLPSGK